MSYATDLLAEMKHSLGLRQTEMARLLGVSQGRVSQMNTGREPMPEHIALKIAQLLGKDGVQVLAHLRADYAETKEVRDTWLKLVTGTAAAIVMSPMLAIHDCVQCIFIRTSHRYSYA